MSKVSFAVGLVSLLGVAAMSASAATETIDAHQRARELIVAPAVVHAPAPRGAMGRLIEEPASLDALAQARSLIQHDQWPSAAENRSVGAATDMSGYADAQSQIRWQIQGHVD